MATHTLLGGPCLPPAIDGGDYAELGAAVGRRVGPPRPLPEPLFW